MKKNYNYLTLSIIAILIALPAKTQIIPELPGATFTEVQTDARAAALGGTANISEASAMGVFNNASANLFSNKQWMVGANLSTLNKEGGNNLIAIGAHHNLGNKHGLSLGFRHYGYKSVDIISAGGKLNGKFSPREMTIDLGYGYKFTDNLSLALTGRFINSDFGAYKEFKSARAFAADLGLTYHGEMTAMNGGSYNIAIVASNFGTGLKYKDGADAL